MFSEARPETSANVRSSSSRATGTGKADDRRAVHLAHTEDDHCCRTDLLLGLHPQESYPFIRRLTQSIIYTRIVELQYMYMYS